MIPLDGGRGKFRVIHVLSHKWFHLRPKSRSQIWVIVAVAAVIFREVVVGSRVKAVKFWIGEEAATCSGKATPTPHVGSGYSSYNFGSSPHRPEDHWDAAARAAKTKTSINNEKPFQAPSNPHKSANLEKGVTCSISTAISVDILLLHVLLLDVSIARD